MTLNGFSASTNSKQARVQTSKVSLPNICTPLYQFFPNVLTVCRETVIISLKNGTVDCKACNFGKEFGGNICSLECALLRMLALADIKGNPYKFSNMIELFLVVYRYRKEVYRNRCKLILVLSKNKNKTC